MGLMKIAKTVIAYKLMRRLMTGSDRGTTRRS